MITGIWCVIGFDLSWRQTSKPSRSGIITSSSTMSHSARSHSASASTPLQAVVTSKYSAERRASSSFTLAGTSSTTRTRAVIDAPSCSPKEMTDRFDEFPDRNRLRQICLAASFADPLLLAIHGESRDCDNRNGFELGIVFEPLGHFEPRHFRQLDIHQDQIRLVFAGKIES